MMEDSPDFDLAVRDIMVPRARMDCVEIDTSIDEILDFVTEIAHSRFPVIEGRKDNVIGIILTRYFLFSIKMRKT